MTHDGKHWKTIVQMDKHLRYIQHGPNNLTVTIDQPRVQVTKYIAATVIAETTALADQNPLTTQFYLLLAESPL